MARHCSICTHAQSADIDAAIIAGASYRDIALQYGVTAGSLGRHIKNHLLKTLAAARRAEAVADGDDLLVQVKDLRRQAQAIKDKAEKEGELRTALAGVRELVRIAELLAKLRGELDTRPVVNVWQSSQWVQVRAVVLDALGPYPDARAHVAAALLETGDNGRGD